MSFFDECAGNLEQQNAYRMIANTNNSFFLTGKAGTGKSTLLNILAQKLQLKRSTPFNHTVLFDEYMDYCQVRMSDMAYGLSYQASDYGRIITSDEVFEHILVTRYENEESITRNTPFIVAYFFCIFLL